MRKRPTPVRVRTTIVAVLVVGAALLVASCALVISVRRSAVERVRSGAELRAGDIVAALDSGLAADELDLDEGEDRVVQIQRGDAVIAASPALAGLPPIDANAGTDARIDGTGDDRWVIALGDAEDGSRVVVGRELDGPLETVATVVVAVGIGAPILLVVVGVTIWRLAGRALAPVEAIRREAETIGSGELHRRVPVPVTDDEISRLATTVNGMLARLEEGRSRERRFVADASHELRGPLAVIRQRAELALARPADVGAGELASVVLTEGDRLASLVDDLLVLARLDEGALVASAALVDLDDLVAEQRERLPTHLTLDLSAVSAGQVRGDRPMLRRVVDNVVANAARHADSEIAVTLHERDGAVVLIVDDDGPGIPPRERERVFDRFVRLDEARGRDGGAGLGLAIVAEVAAAHGGNVRVDDSSLGGARVVITLPASG